MIRKTNLMLVALMAILSGCIDHSQFATRTELEELRANTEARIAKLQQSCAEINTNIASIQSRY